MLQTVWFTARHEITRALRRRTFRVVFVLVTLLLAVAFSLEAQRQAGEREERQALQALVSAQWGEQPDRHPHRMAHYGSFAFRPPSALGFFEPGVEPFTGSSVYLEAHKRNTPSFSEASEGSELTRFGRPTAAFVLQLLLPLLIFAMTFESVAGEREAGTWLLALSQGASTRALMLGKLLGNVVLVSLWVLPIVVLAFGLFALFGALVLTADMALRGALLALVYAGYLSLCAGLGVLVSSLHVRSHDALATLLCVWIVGWVVVPRVASEVAARTHPLWTRAALESELSRASHSVGSGHGKNPETVALTDKTLAQHGVKRVEDLPINLNGLLTQLGEERTSKLYDRFYQQLYQTQRAQEELVLRFGLLSPVLVLRAASMALAGSDSHQFAGFLEQAEQHRFGFIKQLNGLHAKHLRYEAHDNLQRASSEHWRDFSPFVYYPPELAQLSSLWRDGALGLLAWVTLLSLLGVLATRREAAL